MAAKTPRLRYHCVSVVAGQSACAAAQSLLGTRILSADAPRLPLDGCDTPAACQCTYRHYGDRRLAPRRARERGELADPWACTDRRRVGGRRATD
jgi:hypothetical protein